MMWFVILLRYWWPLPFVLLTALHSPSDNRIVGREYFFTSGLSSTDYQVVVRSLLPSTVYLLFLVDLVPLMFLGGDVLGSDVGLGSIGLASGDFATSSFSLLDTLSLSCCYLSTLLLEDVLDL